MTYPTKKLREVCEINMGQSPASSTYNNNQNGLPFYQGKKDYGEKYPTPRVWCSNPIKIVEAGDILISVRAPVGALNIAKEKSCIGRGLAGLRAKKELEQNFLFHYLQLKEKDIAGLGTGSTFTAISKKHLENLQIPLPPLTEQKKIVVRLEGLLGKIKGAKRLRAEAQEAAQSLFPAELHRIFTKQHSNILENVRMSGKPASVKNYGAAQWEEKELGEITTLVRGPFGGSLKKDIFVETGDCVYEQGNVIDGDIKNFRYFITPEKFDQMKRFAVSAGDILMSCSGTIGRFVIVPEKFKKGIINQALLKITPSQKISSEFLKFMLENYFSSNKAHVKGMAIKNIAAVKELKKIKIPLPPVAEQKKIVARLDSLSEKIKNLREYQTQTRSDFIALEQSILSKSFQHS